MKSKLKKVETIVSILIFVLAAFILFNVVIARINKDVPRIFGYSFHLVTTGSMTPEIEVGDLVFAKKIDKSKIVLGDDIVFISDDPLIYGEPVVHRVVGINPDGSFQTQGIKEGLGIDPYAAVNVVGIVVGKSTFFGEVFTFFSDISRIIFFVVFIVLIYVIAKLAFKFVKIIREPATDANTEAGHEIDSKEVELKQLKEQLKAELEAEQTAKASDKGKIDD